MSKRSLIAYILCGAILLGVSFGIFATANAVIDDMVETAVHDIYGSDISGSEHVVQKPNESESDDNLTISTAPTGGSEPSDDGSSETSATNPTVTEPPSETVPNVTEPSDAGQTQPESTEPMVDDSEPTVPVPDETKPVSDDTGDGGPSDSGVIEGNGPGEESNIGDTTDSNASESENSNESDESGVLSEHVVVILIEYVVKSGDTLNEIAAAHDADPKAIANLNNIGNINLIYVGDVFLIPVKSMCCTCCQPVSQ